MFLEILLLTIHFVIIREIEKQTDILKALHSEIDTLTNKIGKLTSTVNAWRMEATIHKLTDRSVVKNENPNSVKSNATAVAKQAKANTTAVVKQAKAQTINVTKMTKSEKKKLREEKEYNRRIRDNLKLAQRNGRNNIQHFDQHFAHRGHQFMPTNPYIGGTDYTPRYQRTDYRYANGEQQYGMDYRM